MKVTLLILLITTFLLIPIQPSISADEPQISNQGLIAYYNFDEGTGAILHDTSGNNHDGTIIEGTWTDGISGNALEFNGITTYVSLPPSTLSNWNALTYSFWVKAPQYTGLGWPAFMGSYTTSYTYNTFIGISRNTETIHIEIDTDTGNYETKGEIPIPWDTWFHAALVYDGSTLTEYINGEPGISIPATGTLKNVTELNIGQLGSGRYFFHGLLDETYIFKRALSPVEIKNLYAVSRPASSDTNYENHAAEKSPLNLIMDKKYVPVVATATSIILLYLWNIIGNTVVEFVFDYASEKVADKKIKGKKVKKKTETTHKFLVYIDLREIISIVSAIIIFSIAMSWTWSADLSTFFELFFINVIVIGCIFLLRESLRIYYSHQKNLKTEHVFWPFGAILTIGSTLLGNTFSLASYTIVEEEEQTKNYGKMYFLISLIIFSISIFAFILNYINPSVILQMTFVFCIMGLFIDMAPINPMDGYDIKKWDFKKWLILYIAITISYITMNFSLYN